MFLHKIHFTEIDREDTEFHREKPIFDLYKSLYLKKLCETLCLRCLSL